MAAWIARQVALFLRILGTPGIFSMRRILSNTWQRIGQSTGRGRLVPQPIRDIWVYPLHPRFRAVLTDDRCTDAAPSPRGGSLR